MDGREEGEIQYQVTDQSNTELQRPDHIKKAHITQKIYKEIVSVLPF